MKKRALSFLLTAAMVLSLNTLVFAEETKTTSVRPDSEIAVQLDGEYIIFPDSQPEFKDNLTYMPLRAFLEALGAEVSYSNATGIVTASKGDLKVESRIGSTKAMITENGASRSVETTSAPYISSGRTMVPARYASEIFGLGYDNLNKTVVIIDTAKITDSLTDSFTLVDKYMTFANNVAGDNSSVDGTLNLSITDKMSDEASTIKAAGTINGLVSKTKSDMSIAIDFDEASLKEALGEESEDITAIKAVLDNLKMNLAMDMKEGSYYYQYPSIAPLMGYSPETWFKLDMNQLFAESGIPLSLESLLSLNESGLKNVLGTVLAYQTPSSINDYGEMLKAMALVEDMLGDSAFKKVGDNYVSTYKTTLEGADIELSIKLLMDGASINGYDISAYVKDGSSSVSVVSKLDSKLNATVSMNFTLENMFEMAFGMDVKYSPTTQSPLGAPAEGSKIVDLSSLLFNGTIPQPETGEM